MDIKQKINNYPTKYKEGYILYEIEKIIGEFPTLNLTKFKATLNGSTCMEINSELIIYKNDVLKALQLGLNIISDNWINWD